MTPPKKTKKPGDLNNNIIPDSKEKTPNSPPNMPPNIAVDDPSTMEMLRQTSKAKGQSPSVVSGTPATRVVPKTPEQLYGKKKIAPKDLATHAQEALEKQYGGPEQKNGKYTDPKLQGLREEGYASTEGVLRNLEDKSQTNPEKYDTARVNSLLSKFRLVTKNDWASRGTSKIAHTLRSNPESQEAADLIQMLHHATGNAIGPDGSRNTSVDVVGKLLRDYSRIKNKNLHEFTEELNSLPNKEFIEEKSAIHCALMLTGMYEEAKYALDQDKPNLNQFVSGRTWYKDMTSAMDKGLAHLFHNHAAYKDFAGNLFGDGETATHEQMRNLHIFKGILAPTSNEQQPIANGFITFNVFRASIAKVLETKRQTGDSSPIQMWDVLADMQVDQSIFGGGKGPTDFKQFIKMKNASGEDIFANAKHRHLWGQMAAATEARWAKTKINPDTGNPYTARELLNALNKNLPLVPTNAKTGETGITKFMKNSVGFEDAVTLYKAFINGRFNGVLGKEYQVNLSAKNGKQDAVNKLADFLDKEHGTNVLRAVMQQLKGEATPENYARLGDNGINFDRHTALPGSWLLGGKIGLFYQNLNNNDKWVTADMWVMRSFGRLISGITGDAPLANKDDTQRAALQKAFAKVGSVLGLAPSEMQAVMWYYEQQLWKSLGADVDSESFEDFVKDVGDIHAKYDPNFIPHHRKGEQNAHGAAANQGGAPPNPGADIPSNQEARGAGVPKPPKPNAPVRKKIKESKRGLVLKFAQFLPMGNGMSKPTAPTADPNVGFGNAIAKSNTGKNIAQAQLGDQISAKAGVKTQAHTAIGDWPDGSEQSTVHYAQGGVDPSTWEYLGAMHGIAGQKKSMLVFHPNDKGPDSLYRINHPETDQGKLRQMLNKSGLSYKTLVPGSKGTQVLMYDPGRAKRNAVGTFATQNGVIVEESTGQGRIIGHNGSWNSAGALPKSRQVFRDIIANHGQQPVQKSSTGGPDAASADSSKLSRQGTKRKFDRSRRILEGFLRAHNTPNKELPPIGDLLAPDLQGIKPQHLGKYQELIPGAKWGEIEGAVKSLQQDPSLYEDMTSEGNRRESYCKEHARSVLNSSGVKKLLDSLVVNKMVPEYAMHLVQDAKDGDFHSLDALSAEMDHSIPSLKAYCKAAEREFNKAGKAWDKMRTGTQKFAKHHSKSQHRAGPHGVISPTGFVQPGGFVPMNHKNKDGKTRFEKQHKNNIVAFLDNIRNK